MLKILYFAGLPDLLGRTGEEMDVSEGVCDVEGLLQQLRGRGGRWRRLMQEPTVQVTVNRRFATANTPIQDGDEVAIVNTRP